MSTTRSRRSKPKTTASRATVSRSEFAALPKLSVEIEGDVYEYPDYPAIGRRYAEMVASGELLSCRMIKLACKRYLKMHDMTAKKGAKFYFAPEWAVDACDFIEKLPLSKGGRAGQLLELQPWQIFLICAIFGFRRSDPEFPVANGSRLCRDVYLEIPRGSGKSELVAGIGLYCFCCEGEQGSQVFIGAPKDDQADKVYIPMKTIVEATPELTQAFSLKKPTLDKIGKFGDSSAFITKISHVAEREDGHDPHVTIMEELHAQDDGLYKVMQSAQGKRQISGNLFLQITTAGRRASGLGWQVRKRVMNMLEGVHEDFSMLGLIYTVDQEEIDDERLRYRRETIMKANPMWGISLDPSLIMEQISKAKMSSPSDVMEFDRTRLNIWRNVDGGLILPENWKACYRPGMKIEDFHGKPVWIGMDLASKNDIAALVVLFNQGGRLQMFGWYYLPERSPAFLKESTAAMYTGWVKAGHLITTPGGVTDYSYIGDKIRFLRGEHEIKAIVSDAYQSNQLLAELFAEGLPAVQMNPGTKNISDPAKDFFAQIADGQFEHDGNPVTEWMAMNVVGHMDKRGNILPQKDDPNSPNKIDGIAAAVMARATMLDAMFDPKLPKKIANPYNARAGELFRLDGEPNEPGRREEEDA